MIRLSESAYDLYDTIRLYVGYDNTCQEKLTRLVKRSGYSLPTVRRALRELVDKGCLKIEYRFDAHKRPLANRYLLLVKNPSGSLLRGLPHLQSSPQIH